MVTLNRAASEAALAAGVAACTDVTGFGLLGHLREMVLASGVGVEVRSHELPLLPGAFEYSAAGFGPGGTDRNRDFAACLVDGLDCLAPALEGLLFDPQTSGGLLMAVPPAGVAGLVRRLGPGTRVIGTFLESSDSPRIRVR
jgi:selenide,water dikinase